MIRYRKGCGGLFVLFRVVGTSWPFGILAGLLAMSESLIFSYVTDLDATIRDKDSPFIGDPYAFDLFADLLGFIIVFRTNNAYQRYWEAIGAVNNMAAKWLDGAIMGIAFDAGGRWDRPLLDGATDEASCTPHPKFGDRGGPTHSEFYSEIVHLCSLLHALALMHLRNDENLDNIELAYPTAEGSKPLSVSSKMHLYGISTFDPNRFDFAAQKLPVLGGLKPEERLVLETGLLGSPLPTEARVAMVEGWFMRRLIARQKFEQGESSQTSSPVLCNLYQVISDGTLYFCEASKVAMTPFPFPYANVISVYLWILYVPGASHYQWSHMDIALRAVLVCVTVFAYHALNNIGDNLEDPFLPYDPNELPLPAMLHGVNMRLFAFGVVPEYGIKGMSPRPSIHNGSPADGSNGKVRHPLSPRDQVVGRPVNGHVNKDELVPMGRHAQFCGVI
ncbi:unnamed protein product [Polarella glacialis]|uniref:Uncharacterized protein n=1 Tax=Polarella glacialis TaxID=89957 RepID=A0A813LHX3_POLGL|nr:unnamed protein product [Polarella glacialis]